MSEKVHLSGQLAHESILQQDEAKVNIFFDFLEHFQISKKSYWDFFMASGKYMRTPPIRKGVLLRIAINSDYNKILYCEYKKNIVNSRILEDDIITVYGTSYGIYTYEATSGASISIPAVIIDKIDQ